MENNKHSITFQSIFKIGTVCSVDGRTVRVKVDKLKNSSHLFYKGELVKNVSVGSYLKIIKGFIPIIGKVEKEIILPNNNLNESNYFNEDDLIERELTIKLVGYLESNNYLRGIKELPLIGNECFLLTNDEFEKIHYFVKNEDDVPLKIGTLASDHLIPIELGVNVIFSGHIGIFGNTGSGKSYTLSKLYKQLFVRYGNNSSFKENAKFLFFDFNGEYSGKDTIVSNKKIYNLSTRHKDNDDRKDKIPLTDADMLNLDLLCIFANATEKTQRPFIKRCINLYKHIRTKEEDVYGMMESEEHLKNIIRNQIGQILFMSDKIKSALLLDYIEQILPPIDQSIDDYQNIRDDIGFHDTSHYYYLLKADNAPDKEPYQNKFVEHPELIQETKLYKHVDKFKLNDNFIETFIVIMYIQLIYDVLGNRAMNEHIAPAIRKLESAKNDIGKLFDFSDNNASFWGENNIVVINLNETNLDAKKMLPMIVCRKLYDAHKKKREKDLSYLNIIVDEAHNILSYQSKRESETWKDYRLEVFEEIIKEGRKFGVFMTIASQRPSDISSTIISQLHNFFIHRLINEHDIEMVSRTISYLDKISVESLPILPTGTCIIAGQFAEMPIVIQIDKIEEQHKPINETIDVVKKWMSDEQSQQ